MLSGCLVSKQRISCTLLVSILAVTRDFLVLTDVVLIGQFFFPGAHFLLLSVSYQMFTHFPLVSSPISRYEHFHKKTSNNAKHVPALCTSPYAKIWFQLRGYALANWDADATCCSGTSCLERSLLLFPCSGCPTRNSTSQNKKNL